MNIIFLSNQLFDYPLKTNKWHVATRVAKLGHDVLFVDPPIRFRKFIKQIFQGRWSLRRILTFAYQPRKESVEGCYENLIVYTTVGLIPFSSSDSACTIFGPFGQQIVAFLGLLNQRFHLWRIKGLLKNSSSHHLIPSSPRILWIYHVEMEYLEKYIEGIPHDLLIYDCVDNYPSFPRYRKNPELKNWIVGREGWLASKADLIFTTAPGLQDKLSKLNKNTFYVGNAGDYERFSVQPDGFRRQPVGLGNSAGKRTAIGFTGAIDGYKVNLPLLVKIAKAYPNYSLVLIGPTGVADDEPNLKELESLPNTHLLGEKPYEEMPQYFAQFAVYIIPYNLNEYTVGGCFPVKFFDALSAGLPTVVTNLPCYKDFSGVCYIAKDNEDFVRMIKTAWEENSTAKIAERQKVAKENSWDRKVERMLRIVSFVI